MSEIIIKKCDICGKEQRSDEKPSSRYKWHSDGVNLDFRKCYPIQMQYSYKHLCLVCYTILNEAVLKGIKSCKTRQILYEGNNADKSI